MAFILCPSYFSLVTILLVYLASQSSSLAAGLDNVGFSFKLIHKNSPKSPFSKAISPSIKRPMLFNPIPNTAQSQVRANNGQYLMKLSIGNPSFDVYGIADTGSDLVWTQCVPCDSCYKQINPKFDPKNSSTYTALPCDAQECRDIGTGVCTHENTCNYTYGYGGGLTQGALANEKITVMSTSGKEMDLGNFVFGCGHNNSGSLSETEMGIIGLGGGPLSLVSQLAPFVGGRKLSFCLPPFHTDSHIVSNIKIGEGSEVLGDDVVSTPLVAVEDKTPYLVTLEGIRVGDKLVPYGSSGQVKKGNMLMDTGTPPMLLPQDFYDRLVAEVRGRIRMKPIEDDPTLGTQLCYKKETNLEGPILTVHFEGANVTLTPTQTFIPPKDGVFCFAMHNVTSEGGIYGNFAQSNFLIGYDLDKMVAYFKPTDCTNQS